MCFCVACIACIVLHAVCLCWPGGSVQDKSLAQLLDKQSFLALARKLCWRLVSFLISGMLDYCMQCSEHPHSSVQLAQSERQTTAEPDTVLVVYAQLTLQVQLAVVLPTQAVVSVLPNAPVAAKV